MAIRKQIRKHQPTLQTKSNSQRKRSFSSDINHEPHQYEFSNFPAGAIMDNVTTPPQNLSPVQAKLTLGDVGDKYEQEADIVSKKVMQKIHAPISNVEQQNATVQRETLEEKVQMKPTLQRREALEGGEVSTELESSIKQAKGSGQPLDANLQQSMGQAMGADFSHVKVHTDSRADRLNQSIQAKAFTTERDIFFRQGEYNPGSNGGQELIAHELTHVVQQKPDLVQKRRKTPDPMEGMDGAKPIQRSNSRSDTPNIQRATWKRVNVPSGVIVGCNIYNDQDGVRTRQDLEGDDDYIVDIDLDVYPHIKEEALDYYNRRGPEDGPKEGIGKLQESVMYMKKPLNQHTITSFPGGSQIDAEVIHPGGRAVTYQYEDNAQAIGLALKKVFKKVPGFTAEINQQDPRHASTHFAEIPNAHDHWFKWPPEAISDDDLTTIHEKLASAGLIES